MKKIVVIFTLALSTNVWSQNDVAALHKLISSDSSSARVIFSYPDSSRTVIFTAATYPQGFTRLEEIQKNTSAAFKKAVSKYNQSKQKQLWDISRYPGLIAMLINNKDKSEAELNILLKVYPQETKKAALFFVKKEYPILVEMENIRLDFESKYKMLVNDFPVEIQNSFNTLLRDPELISILTSDIKTTIKLGDLYKRNPGLLKHTADSVNAQIAKESGKEYEDWKAGISKDSTVQKELKQVSGQYAKDEEYLDDVYKSEDRDVTVIYNTPPYPYWAGYPYWYETPYWHPYPWWYHSGFYWNPGGRIIFFGMPSYHFGWWYYNHPHYYQRYRRTSDFFDHHYQGHPHSNNGFNRSINEWQRRTPAGGTNRTPERRSGSENKSGGRRR